MIHSPGWKTRAEVEIQQYLGTPYVGLVFLAFIWTIAKLQRSDI